MSLKISFSESRLQSPARDCLLPPIHIRANSLCNTCCAATPPGSVPIASMGVITWQIATYASPVKAASRRAHSSRV
jgi:hypothetical protein